LCHHHRHHPRNQASRLDFRGGGLPSAPSTPTTREIEHLGLISRVVVPLLLPPPPPPTKLSRDARFRGLPPSTREIERLGSTSRVGDSLLLPPFPPPCKTKCLSSISRVVDPPSAPSTPIHEIEHRGSISRMVDSLSHHHHPRNLVWDGYHPPFSVSHPPY